MGEKIISIVTLFFFIVLLISCTSISYEKRIQRTTPDNPAVKGLLIHGLQTSSGDYIEFLKDPQAWIDQNHVKGYRTKKSFISKSEVKNVTQRKKDLSELETQDGKRYLFISIRAFNLRDQYICHEYISIPIPEIELLWVETVTEVRKVNALKTMGLVLGAGALVFTAAAVIALATKQSCPFIYSFDGESYIFDAEPYGGAICERLKRTEWCILENLKEVKGQYKILITNEVDETQYTDELKLTLVDHPKGIAVIPDISGQYHTISQPIIPLKTYDNRGHDLLPLVSKNDRMFWQTRIHEKNPERKEDLRDELIFEFPKPDGIKKAKLIVNACNTLWGSQSLKQYLELHGNKVMEWYEEVKNNEPAFYRMVNTHVREELFSLNIRVETENGWSSKGRIIGGGPFISEDKLYILDISDVSGEELKIKLTPPAAFWMINYLAVDYSENLPIQTQEVEAIKAVDHNGQEVKEVLAKKDNNYLLMPDIGNSTELVFESPQLQEDMARTVILKACGYYDIHLEAKGEPQMDTIERFFTEPGYVVQYALKEYLKWKGNIVQTINKKQ